MKYFLLILVSLSFISCASYQTGTGADIVSGDHPENTPIMGYIDDTYSTKYFTLLQFSFGNYSDYWKRVESVKLDFGSKEKNQNIKITLGNDLLTWSDSIQHKIAVDNYNTEMLLGAIAATSAVYSASSAKSGNFKNASLGAGIFAGAITIDSINKISSKKNDLERAELLPKGHLYRPFAIPAGLVTKRWILLETTQDELPQDIFIDIKYKSGKEVRYKVRFSTFK